MKVIVDISPVLLTVIITASLELLILPFIDLCQEYERNHRNKHHLHYRGEGELFVDDSIISPAHGIFMSMWNRRISSLLRKFVITVILLVELSVSSQETSYVTELVVTFISFTENKSLADVNPALLVNSKQFAANLCSLATKYYEIEITEIRETMFRNVNTSICLDSTMFEYVTSVEPKRTVEVTKSTPCAFTLSQYQELIFPDDGVEDQMAFQFENESFECYGNIVGWKCLDDELQCPEYMYVERDVRATGIGLHVSLEASVNRISEETISVSFNRSLRFDSYSSLQIGDNYYITLDTLRKVFTYTRPDNVELSLAAIHGSAYSDDAKLASGEDDTENLKINYFPASSGDKTSLQYRFWFFSILMVVLLCVQFYLGILHPFLARYFGCITGSLNPISTTKYLIFNIFTTSRAKAVLLKSQNGHTVQEIQGMNDSESSNVLFNIKKILPKRLRPLFKFLFDIALIALFSGILFFFYKLLSTLEDRQDSQEKFD